MDPKASRAPSAFLVALCGMAHCDKVFFRTRQARSEKSSDAIRQLAAPDSIERFVRRIAEVASSASMGMDIDKSRQQRQTIRLNRAVTVRQLRVRADSCNPALRDAHRHDAEILSRRHDTRTRNEDPRFAATHDTWSL